MRLGPQHVRDDRIRYRQAKNEHRNPVDMDIPLHPDLAGAIAATTSGHLSFMVTAYGKDVYKRQVPSRSTHYRRKLKKPRDRQRNFVTPPNKHGAATKQFVIAI